MSKIEETNTHDQWVEEDEDATEEMKEMYREMSVEARMANVKVMLAHEDITPDSALAFVQCAFAVTPITEIERYSDDWLDLLKQTRDAAECWPIGPDPMTVFNVRPDLHTGPCGADIFWSLDFNVALSVAERIAREYLHVLNGPVWTTTGTVMNADILLAVRNPSHDWVLFIDPDDVQDKRLGAFRWEMIEGCDIPRLRAEAQGW